MVEINLAASQTKVENAIAHKCIEVEGIERLDVA